MYIFSEIRTPFFFQSIKYRQNHVLATEKWYPKDCKTNIVWQFQWNAPVLKQKSINFDLKQQNKTYTCILTFAFIVYNNNRHCPKSSFLLKYSRGGLSKPFHNSSIELSNSGESRTVERVPKGRGSGAPMMPQVHVGPGQSLSAWWPRGRSSHVLGYFKPSV